MKRNGQCEKCGTKMAELFEYNDMLLCKTNFCYQEEQEKDSGKNILDEEALEEYRNLVNGTKGIEPSTY